MRNMMSLNAIFRRYSKKDSVSRFLFVADPVNALIIKITKSKHLEQRGRLLGERGDVESLLVFRTTERIGGAHMDRGGYCDG
jgi:hypothetical protein